MIRMYIILFVVAHTVFNFSYAMKRSDDSEKSQYNGQYIFVDDDKVLPIEDEQLESFIGSQVLYKSKTKSKKYEVVVLGDNIGGGDYYKAYRSNDAGIVCSRQSLFRTAEQK